MEFNALNRYDELKIYRGLGQLLIMIYRVPELGFYSCRTLQTAQMSSHGCFVTSRPGMNAVKTCSSLDSPDHHTSESSVHRGMLYIPSHYGGPTQAMWTSRIAHSKNRSNLLPRITYSVQYSSHKERASSRI